MGSREEQGNTGGFERGRATNGFPEEDARFGTLSGLWTGSGGDPGRGCGKVSIETRHGERLRDGRRGLPGCGAASSLSCGWAEKRFSGKELRTPYNSGMFWHLCNSGGTG